MVTTNVTYSWTNTSWDFFQPNGGSGSFNDSCWYDWWYYEQANSVTCPAGFQRFGDGYAYVRSHIDSSPWTTPYNLCTYGGICTGPCNNSYYYGPQNNGGDPAYWTPPLITGAPYANATQSNFLAQGFVPGDTPVGTSTGPNVLCAVGWESPDAGGNIEYHLGFVKNGSTAQPYYIVNIIDGIGSANNQFFPWCTSGSLEVQSIVTVIQAGILEPGAVMCYNPPAASSSWVSIP